MIPLQHGLILAAILFVLGLTGLAPVAAGDHEGQRGGVNHDFQPNQHKQQVTADNQTG